LHSKVVAGLVGLLTEVVAGDLHRGAAKQVALRAGLHHRGNRHRHVNGGRSIALAEMIRLSCLGHDNNWCARPIGCSYYLIPHRPCNRRWRSLAGHAHVQPETINAICLHEPHEDIGPVLLERGARVVVVHHAVASGAIGIEIRRSGHDER